MNAPTRAETRQVLVDLSVGRISRERADLWAAPYVLGDVRVDDPIVWSALLSIHGADLPTTDRDFLSSEEDFREWLAEFDRDASP